jgi:uncharacterized FlaG/YvyC family protein
VNKEEKKYNNHTRNQRRMFRIKKQEEKINDLKLLVGSLQSQLDNANKKIEKLDNEIKSVINIIKQQPSNDDEWILGRLNGFLSIIGGE